MQISAQVSLYPLRQERLSPAIEEAWKIFQEYELEVQKGSMSTVINGEAEKVFGAIRHIFLISAQRGPVALIVTFSNACPV
ncbi:MAG: thiamine-binding protein [Deltaproteobacteria bacterium]|nr:thiamine-binding protein [Deltaproteobacteria bacterium]MBW2308791.1 thiamine-binding protein [Deltaproteobacteria bacterium]